VIKRTMPQTNILIEREYKRIIPKKYLFTDIPPRLYVQFIVPHNKPLLFNNIFSIRIEARNTVSFIAVPSYPPHPRPYKPPTNHTPNQKDSPFHHNSLTRPVNIYVSLIPISFIIK
jgi:hypothetical protein